MSSLEILYRLPHCPRYPPAFRELSRPPKGKTGHDPLLLRKWFIITVISLNNTQKGDTGALLMATTRTRWCYIRLSPRAACRPHRALALSSPPTSWRATSARQRSCPFRPRRIGTTARAGARSPVRGGWEWRMGGWWCGERVVLGLPRALALGFFVRILPDQGNVVVSS